MKKKQTNLATIKRIMAMMPVRVIKRKLYLCHCEDCDEYFIGERRRHVMYSCPECKKSAVDIEEHYSRILGNCRILKQIQIPKVKKDDKMERTKLRRKRKNRNLI